MGDPRRIKNKYKTPIHPWEKLRLEAERPLMKEYGLVNKKELWKVSSKLKNFKDTAKKLVASKSEQALVEKKQMVERMKSYGLINTEELDEILGLEIQQLLSRRLQTVVFKKGLARSVKQARQMIVHRHISVNGIKVTAPGYLVKVSEQDTISFTDTSKFVNDSHPERVLPENSVSSEKPVEAVKKVKEEPKKEEVKTETKEEPKAEEKQEKSESKDNKEESQKEEKQEKSELKKEEVKTETKQEPKAEKTEEKVEEKKDE